MIDSLTLLFAISNIVSVLSGKTALEVALAKGHDDIVEFLTEIQKQSNKAGELRMIEAAKHNDLERLKHSIELEQTNIEAKDNKGGFGRFSISTSSDTM